MEYYINIGDCLGESVEEAWNLISIINNIIDYSKDNDIHFNYNEKVEVAKFKIVVDIETTPTIKMEMNIKRDGIDTWVELLNVLPNDNVRIKTYTSFSEGEYENIISIIIKNKDGIDKNRSFLLLSKLESYKDYLKTYDWNETRKVVLKEANYKCQLCGIKNVKLNVHHNTYENIGNEHRENLIVLCDDCHKKFHNIEQIDK